MCSINTRNARRAMTLVLNALALLTCAAAVAAVQSPGRVQVSDPRPLAAVLDELEKRHGRVVTYEDPVRTHASDIEDITATVSPERRRAQTVIVPKGGPFTFLYDPPGDDAGKSFPAVVERLLQQFNSASVDAQFRLLRAGAMLHVVPAASKDDSGVLRTAASPLDTTISIPDGARMGFEQLWAIRTALREAGVSRFSLGTVPVGALRKPTNGVVQKESARKAIMRVLDESPYKLSYRMFCDAGPSPTCALNVHPIPVQKQ